MSASGKAAYEVAMQMHNAYRGIPKPSPEAFGLTDDEAADAAADMPSDVEKILGDMQHAAGVRTAKDRKRG